MYAQVGLCVANFVCTQVDLRMSIGAMTSSSFPSFSLICAVHICQAWSDALVIACMFLQTSYIASRPSVLFWIRIVRRCIHPSLCVGCLPHILTIQAYALAGFRTFSCNNLCACFPAVSISPPALALFFMFRAATLPQIDPVGHCPETLRNMKQSARSPKCKCLMT